MGGLRLGIDPPANGWATVRLTASGVVLEFAASYTPRDSIGDLAGAAAGLAACVPDQVVMWNTEPGGYEFRFATTAGRIRLDVREFSHRAGSWRTTTAPAVVVEAGAGTMARTVWRTLRRLQGAVGVEAFAAGWGHPFPTATVSRLGERLRAASQGS